MSEPHHPECKCRVCRGGFDMLGEDDLRQPSHVRIECPWCERPVVLDYNRYIALHEQPPCEAFSHAVKEAQGRPLLVRLNCSGVMATAARAALKVLLELPEDLRVGAVGALLAELECDTPGFSKRVGGIMTQGIALQLKREREAGRTGKA